MFKSFFHRGRYSGRHLEALKRNYKLCRQQVFCKKIHQHRMVSVLKSLNAKDTRIKCQLQLQNSRDLANTLIQQSSCQKVAKILSFKQVKIKLKFQQMSKHLARLQPKYLSCTFIFVIKPGTLAFSLHMYKDQDQIPRQVKLLKSKSRFSRS